MTPGRQLKLQTLHMEVAVVYASMSKLTRKKVGALLVKGDTILSYGWNGMPSGFNDDDGEYFEDTTLVTNPLVLHAESNALMKALKHGHSSEGCDMYVTMSPCVECSKLLVQSGVKRVFYREKYRITTGIDFLQKAGIEVNLL